MWGSILEWKRGNSIPRSQFFSCPISRKMTSNGCLNHICRAMYVEYETPFCGVCPCSEWVSKCFSEWLARNSSWAINRLWHRPFDKYSNHIHPSLPNGSCRIKRTKGTIEGFVRQGFYSTKNISMGWLLYFIWKWNMSSLECILTRANLKRSLEWISILFLELPIGLINFKGLNISSLSYNQIRVSGLYIPKTTFRTRYGHFEFVVIFSRLRNAPTTFINLMNRMFRHYFDVFVILFIDYILIYSKSEGERINHLKIVLQVVKDHPLYAMFSKCEIWLNLFAFPFHIMSRMGI